MTEPTYETDCCHRCQGTGEVLETRYAAVEVLGTNWLGEGVPVPCYWGRAWMQRCPVCQGKAAVVWQVWKFEAVA
jgi:hypothetical protein